MKNGLLAIVIILAGISTSMAAESRVAELFAVDETTRCPVCGMFVHKYPQWLTQVRLSDGTVAAFDGVKDMLAYLFEPERYGAAAGSVVEEVVVKDYYSLEWIDGRHAFYVVGSDILGPMGHELIPFAERAAADNFLADHHGREIVPFAAISREMVDSLRQGSKMRHHGKKGQH
jgi:nitrous oxide reductase accessory protein NosL